MSSDNECPICLGGLMQNNEKVGVCTPCGHCFHENCFQKWKSMKGSSRKNTTCPLCNTKIYKFCHLYLDLSKVRVDADVEDNSVSSDDTDGEDDEVVCVDSNFSNNMVNVSVGTSRQNESSNNDNNIIDLTNISQCELGSENNKKYAKLKAKVSKYKKAATSFKSQFTASLQESIDFSNKFKASIIEQKKLRETLQATTTRYENQLATMNQYVLNVNSMTLRCKELERTIHTKSVEISKLKESNKQLTVENITLKEKHASELNKARVQSMSEMKYILEQQPKLIEENNKLKDQLRKLQFNQKASLRAEINTTQNESNELMSSRERLNLLRSVGMLEQQIDSQKKASRIALAAKSHPIAQSKISPYASSFTTRASAQLAKTSSSTTIFGEQSFHTPFQAPFNKMARNSISNTDEDMPPVAKRQRVQLQSAATNHIRNPYSKEARK